MDHYRDDQSSTTVRSSGSGSRSGIPDDDMEEKENLLESGIRTHSPFPPSKSQKNQRRSRLAILSLPCTTFFLALSNVLLLAALVAATLRPITTTAGTITTPSGATWETKQAKKFPEQPPWEPQV